MKHAKKLIVIVLIFSFVINWQIKLITDSNNILINFNIDKDSFCSLAADVTRESVCENSQRLETDAGEMLLLALMMNNYNINDDILNRLDKRIIIRNKNRMMRFNQTEFAFYKNVLDSLLADIEYFPVARSDSREKFVNYENSWGNGRTYGGERKHEGCDIMSDENKRGIMPVVSVSDGTITNIGWLELGGWRIGITSPGGIYYYYAHLDSYAADFKPGDTICKGTFLGFMGDSGYSKFPDTKGKFDVHLHFGIYIDVNGQEKAINPYYLLKNISNKILYYQY